jgi:hypothetical protein
MYFFEIYVKKCVKLGEKRRVHKKKWSAGKHFVLNRWIPLRVYPLVISPHTHYISIRVI